MWDTQFRKSYDNSEITDLPYSEHALILSVYADGLSSHVTWYTVFAFLYFFSLVTTHTLFIYVGLSCRGIFLKPFITNYIND